MTMLQSQMATVVIAATDNNSQTPNLTETFTIDTKADPDNEIDEDFWK